MLNNMSILAKTNNRAFVLDPAKAEEFLNQKNDNAKKLMERYMSHKPKKGVKVPFK